MTHTLRRRLSSTATSWRIGALCSALAVLLLAAAACGGHSTEDAQVLRTCVDRWNQRNMLGWGPAPANISFRRPVARERASIELSLRRQCIVSIAAGNGTWTCVLTGYGAYYCPPRHEPTGPPLTDKNATIDRRGVLELDSPLKGAHPTPPLAWQRYPHVDGFVEPWTSSGRLRGGLRFEGEDRGPCFVVSETVRSGVSCLDRTLSRADACFPQRQNYRVGDLAACAGLGDTSFVRWVITPDISNAIFVSPVGRIGDLWIGRSSAATIRRLMGAPEFIGRGKAGANLGVAYKALAYSCALGSGGVGLDPGGVRPSNRRCRTVFYLDPKTGKLAGFWTEARQFQTIMGTEPGMREELADRLEGAHPHVGALTGIERTTRGATLFIENKGCKPGPNLNASPCLGGRVRALILEGRHPVGLLEDAIPNA